MHENELPSPPTPPRRGVFRAAAPRGWVAFQAIAAGGRELAYFRLPRRAFDPIYLLALWSILEVSDPLPDRLRTAAFLRAALAVDCSEGSVGHTRKP
jgi:hypothetical protein